MGFRFAYSETGENYPSIERFYPQSQALKPKHGAGLVLDGGKLRAQSTLGEAVDFVFISRERQPDGQYIFNVEEFKPYYAFEIETYEYETFNIGDNASYDELTETIFPDSNGVFVVIKYDEQNNTATVKYVNTAETAGDSSGSGGGTFTETDPIYTADKPAIALKTEIASEAQARTAADALKQDVLTAGTNVDITENVISAVIPESHIYQHIITKEDYTALPGIDNLTFNFQISPTTTETPFANLWEIAVYMIAKNIYQQAASGDWIAGGDVSNITAVYAEGNTIVFQNTIENILTIQESDAIFITLESGTEEVVQSFTVTTTDPDNVYTKEQTDAIAALKQDSLSAEQLAFLVGQSEVTYAQLAALKSSGNLIAGTQYLLTDFSPDEQLVLTAVSSNEFEPTAFNPNSPKDILYYDFDENTVKYAINEVVETTNGKLDKSGGTMTGFLAANNIAAEIPSVRNIYAGTTDMTAGTTPLPSGIIYLVYE